MALAAGVTLLLSNEALSPPEQDDWVERECPLPEWCNFVQAPALDVSRAAQQAVATGKAASLAARVGGVVVAETPAFGPVTKYIGVAE